MDLGETMVVMGLTVYRSPTLNTRVHLTPDCPMALRALKKELLEIDLETIQGPKLCAVCFPDYPKIGRVWHPLCRVCKQTRPRPCPHNGAIQVKVMQQSRWHPKEVGPTEHLRWVWPEHASLYNPAH